MTLPIQSASISPVAKTSDQSRPAQRNTPGRYRRKAALLGVVVLGIATAALVLAAPTLAVPIGAAAGVMAAAVPFVQLVEGRRSVEGRSER